MDWTQALARAGVWVLGAALVAGTAIGVSTAHNPPAAASQPGVRITHVTGWWKYASAYPTPWGVQDDHGESEPWQYAGAWFTGKDVPVRPDQYVLLGRHATCTDPATGQEHSEPGERCG